MLIPVKTESATKRPTVISTDVVASLKVAFVGETLYLISDKVKSTVKDSPPGNPLLFIIYLIYIREFFGTYLFCVNEIDAIYLLITHLFITFNK